ncbi:hypothetical protein KC332_g5841 [Hortaea werneckii]|nr:hypothetical protein KC358_g5680 [Hortaea werneckii]KAI6847249.1 hypothetical protein KC350_g3550 [Hortaea werneckii]KAI6927265.1 hypothetical protein KC348_g8446 [Hortaea werneckii]KAI6933674.1 hypothetical protein KC341_g8148 [Hortaea werneckii]KAI6968248.1 hypothetical protein KC321_g8575 [Hortaea werneckii]
MSSNGYGNPLYYDPYNTFINGASTSNGTSTNAYMQPGPYTGTFGDFSQQPQEAASANGQSAMPFGNNYINQQPMQSSGGYLNGGHTYAAGSTDYTGAQQSVGTAELPIDLDAAEPAKEVQTQTQPQKKRAYNKKKPGAATDQNATKAPKPAKGRSKKTLKAEETKDEATDRMMKALKNEEKREAKAEKKKQQQVKPPPLKKPRAPKKGTTEPTPANRQPAIPESQPKLATKVQPEQGDLNEIRKAHQKSKADAAVETNTAPVDLEEDDSHDPQYASEGWQRAQPKVYKTFLTAREMRQYRGGLDMPEIGDLSEERELNELDGCDDDDLDREQFEDLHEELQEELDPILEQRAKKVEMHTLGIPEDELAPTQASTTLYQLEKLTEIQNMVNQYANDLVKKTPGLEGFYGRMKTTASGLYDETKIPRVMPDDYIQLPDGRVKKTFNGKDKASLAFSQLPFTENDHFSLDFLCSADGTATLVVNGKIDLDRIDGDIMGDERDFPPEDEEDQEDDDPNGYIAPEDMLPTFWETPEENAVQQQPTPDNPGKDSASPSVNLAKGTKRPRDDENVGSAGGSGSTSKKQKKTLDTPSDDEGDGIYAATAPGAPVKRKKAKQMNAKEQKETLARLHARNEMFERVKRGLPAQEPAETNEPARPFESRAAAATTVPAAVVGADMANAEVAAPLDQPDESEESDADDDDPEYKRHPDWGKPIPEVPALQPSNEAAPDDIDEAEFFRAFNEPDSLARSGINASANTNVSNGTGVHPAQGHILGSDQTPLSRKHSRSDDKDYEGPMPQKKIAREM